MNTMELMVPGRKKARVEIIPLIDVVFFLLATFVLFTLSLDRIQSIDLTLPKGRDRGPDDSTMVFIQASEGDTLYWKRGSDGSAELIGMAELPTRLAAYKQHVGVPKVLIRGDTKARFGTAVAILDQVRLAGLDEVSVQTFASPTGN